MNLEGRVIAVAGVGGGLGPHVARRIVAEGAIVSGTDRDRERLDVCAAELGDRFEGAIVDLLDEDATRAWADGLAERHGRVDGLLHLVGGWRGGEPLATSPLEDWALLHDLLIRTVQHTSRAFHDHLVASGRGRFVLVSATQAQRPTHTNAAYAAAKAAAETWTLALADAFKDTGATANIVVVTAISEKHTPPEHLADALAWMCSDAAGRMNGQRLSMHG